MKKTPGTVRELLGSPESWTQDAYARDQHGKPVHQNDSSATSWCLVGAIYCVHGAEAKTAIMRCLHMINPSDSNEYRTAPVGAWNDSPERSHKDIVELLENTGI